MTDLLYHKDSYLQNFSAIVKDIDAVLHGVILDKTAFYPGGGGSRQMAVLLVGVQNSFGY
jgi:Ser-tRNA(Ala) deacylase AlaX